MNTVSRLCRSVVIPAAGVFVALTISACCGGGEEKEASASTAACPSKYKQLSAAQKSGQATCSCAPGNVSGSVWGSGIYTTDSAICAAAVHAGAIPASGGTVTVKSAAGCAAYVGTQQNGVSSSKWGKYEGSFYFPGKGDGTCATPTAAATPAAPAAGPCPANFKKVPGLNASSTITCQCSAALMNGSVWGSDIYTQDSSICRAAVHAGVIPASGGKVTAKAAQGCKGYSAVQRNGVSSSKWGSYEASFYFPAKGSGACGS